MKVFDIGGATGYNLKNFTDKNNCYVVDYGEWEITSYASYLCREVSEIPDNLTIDLALCCHTFEFMLDPVKELTAIRKKMTKQGLLYVEVPFGYYREYENTKNF